MNGNFFQMPLKDPWFLYGYGLETCCFRLYVFCNVSILYQNCYVKTACQHLMKNLYLRQNSPMLTPACQYLTLRSLGAPAVLLSLAMQGVFRGFKDTKTPLYATGKKLKKLLIFTHMFSQEFDILVSFNSYFPSFEHVCIESLMYPLRRLSQLVCI